MIQEDDGNFRPKTSLAERVTINQLLEGVRKLLQLKPQVKFLEVVCYWHLKEEQ